MNRIYIIIAFFSVFFNSGIGQNTAIQETIGRKCGAPKMSIQYEEAFQTLLQKKQKFANDRQASVVYNIPVVFHIIHSGETIGTLYNISEAQVISQITTLNEDYRKLNADFSSWVTQSAFSSVSADCEINFCLAKVSPTGALLAEPGINRIQASSKGWTNPPYVDTYIESTIKPNSYWDPAKYLNIWVVYMNDNTLGYAQFPTIPNPSNTTIGDLNGAGGAANTDGVVLEYRALGNTGAAEAPFNKGRTATHEIGHWLGLYHINGDSNCGNDYCSDTPTQKDLSSGCPASAGITNASGCSASPNPPGKMYQNYMDYSDDKCMVMFTASQKARMQTVMGSCVRRSSLNSSTVCAVPTAISEYESSVSFEVYPNPTNGELYIDVSLMNIQDYTVSVLNALGQTIKQVQQIHTSSGKISMDLSDINPGMYFVTVQTLSGYKVKRLMLQ